MALSTVVKESIWIRRMFKELRRMLDDGNIIYEDNQRAIALAKSPEHHVRTKHIDTIYHFIQEYIEKGQIELWYIFIADIVANTMTKPLTRDKHRQLKAKMGIEQTTSLSQLRSMIKLERQVT
jgi:hypothetical protein